MAPTGWHAQQQYRSHTGWHRSDAAGSTMGLVESAHGEELRVAVRQFATPASPIRQMFEFDAEDEQQLELRPAGC